VGFFDWFSKEEEVQSVERREEIVVDFSSFERVTKYIYEKSGITDLDKRALTASRLQNYAKEQGVTTTDAFLKMMQQSDSFYQEVMNIATINESFFFREKRELDWLVGHIKESSERRVDILVLPCSTGEEVYSILILLLDAGISLDRVNIRGYDLNSQAILNAKKGEYDTHSLHNVTEQQRASYFRVNENNLYEIESRIKQKAAFYQRNIFELNARDEQYDIVLSRNMFIYFDAKHRAEALDIIISLLKPNGYYIKGHADSIVVDEKLVNVAYGIYSKQI